MRGKAHRHLGLYEKAKQDLQLGNKLDWDETSFQLQKWVEARVKAREDFERKQKEKRQEHHKQQQQQKPKPADSALILCAH